MASLASPLAPLARRPLAAMTQWRRPIYLVFQALLLAGALAAAVMLSRTQDWQPLPLLLLLLVLSATGDRLTVNVRNQNLSGAFIALVLAMTLLGPSPALALGLAVMLTDALDPASGALQSAHQSRHVRGVPGRGRAPEQGACGQRRGPPPRGCHARTDVRAGRLRACSCSPTCSTSR